MSEEFIKFAILKCEFYVRVSEPKGEPGVS